MIQTWAANIKPLMEEDCYRKYYLEAPVFRKKKADQLKLDKKKAQSIGAWSVYAQMTKFYGLRDDAVYNLSHSGDYVLCSVCTKEQAHAQRVRVGCDIEKVRDRGLNLAKHFFCESEYQQIFRQPDEEKQKEFFYRYWVLKESFMKATRKGLALPLDSFEIALGTPPVLIRQPEEFSEEYHYMETQLENGEYRVAVCSTEQEIDTEIRLIQLGI